MGSWPVDAPQEHSWGPSSSHVGEESDWEDDAVERRQLQSSTSKPSAPLPPSAVTSTSSPSSSSAPMAPPIASLDDGALHHVLGFLDPASLSAAGATSRRLRELVNDPLSDRELWKSFYSQRWRPSDEEETDPPSWRLRYSRRLRDAAALGERKKPLSDLLGGHRGPVRAAAFSSSSSSGGGILCTGGADRRIRLWDLRCSDNDGGGGGSGTRPRAAAASGELLAASAPLPGSVRCLAAGCGLLVSGSGVDARLAVWRRRDQGSAAEDERREENEEEEAGGEEEEEEEGRDSDDFDDDDDDDDFDDDDDSDGRSLSSFSPSAGSDDDDQDDQEESASRRLSSATRRLSLQESDRRRKKGRQAAAAAAAAAATAPAATAASDDNSRRRSRPPPPSFDLSAPPVFLSGHAGPVAAVSVEEGLIYSASWDTTVRVWDPDRTREEREERDERGGGGGEDGYDKNIGNNAASTSSSSSSSSSSPQCVGVVHLRDWGWSVCRRAGRLLVAEGRGAAVFDAETGKAVRRVAPSEADGGRRGDAARVEGSRDGRTLLVARADGSLESVDLRAGGGGGGGGGTSSRRSATAATTAAATTLLLPGGPAPSGLAFDDPWIALASGRGGVALLDARRPRAPLVTFAAAGKGKAAAAAAGAASATATAAAKPALPIPRPPRRLGWSSNAAVRCVEISGKWVVAGCDDGSVRTWWFGGAGEAGGEAGGGGGRGGRRRRRRGGGRGRGGET